MAHSYSSIFQGTDGSRSLWLRKCCEVEHRLVVATFLFIHLGIGTCSNKMSNLFGKKFKYPTPVKSTYMYFKNIIFIINK